MNNDPAFFEGLREPRRYEAWLMSVRQQGLSSSQILQVLEQVDRPEVWLRCARIAIAMDDFRLARDYASRARLSPSREIQVYARALLAIMVMEEARAELKPSEREGAITVLPTLGSTLEELQTLPDKTSLSLEAECVLRLAIAFAHQQMARFEEALVQVSEVLLIARSMGMVLTERGAFTQMTICLVALGRLDESVPLLEQQLRTPIVGHFSVAESRRQLAEVLFTLGDTEGAINLLSDVDPATPWPAAYTQLYRLLSGTGGTAGEVIRGYPWAALFADLAGALRLLISTMALLPQTQNKHLRDYTLRQALKFTEPGDQVRDDWLKAAFQWVRSWTETKQGRLGLAGEALRKVPQLRRQWLDIRLMLAGQQLELGLQLTDSGVQSLYLSEQELRQVFEDAKALPYASRAGLAQRLRFWHPQAAAYAAVMPRPIEELLGAVESILRVGERNSVYGLTVPPIYAIELTLRGLGLDQHRTFEPAHLNKTQIAQRQALFLADAAIPRWKPVISAGLLIQGLYKSSSTTEYQRAAERLARSFGLVPRNKTPYAQAEVRQLEGALRGLLEGRTSHAQFVKILNES